MTLKVRPPSTAGKVTGGILVGVGAAASTVGLVGVVAGAVALSNSSDRSCEQEGGHGDSGIACGLGEGLATLLMVLSGAVLLAGGGIVVGGATLLSESGGSTTQRPTFAREPTWTAPRAGSPGGKSAFVVPLSFSF